ncbi:MAG TPA: hypothetical protein VIE65_23775, partial [Methylobacter sp.]
HGKQGHFHDAWHTDDDEKSAEKWQKESISAYDCPRISKEFLETERNTIGEWWFRQEFLREFVDTMDQLFSTESIMSALTDDVQPLNLRVLS